MAQQEAAVADASARLANANIQLDPRTVAAEHAGRTAIRPSMTRRQSAVAGRAGGGRRRRNCALPRSTWTIPKSTRRSAARSAAPASRVGNVVSPSSGPLATIVSQDPMYVVFPIALRAELDLREALRRQGRLERRGDQAASAGRHAVSARPASSITSSPPSQATHRHDPAARQDRQSADSSPSRRASRSIGALIDGEFVTVLVEGVQPVEALGIPRAAVLSDQQGDYVYVVDAQNKVEQRRIQLGQSTPSTAVVMGGLKRGRDGRRSTASSACAPASRSAPGPAAPTPTAPKPAGQ